MSEHGGDIYRNKVNIDFSVNISPFGMPSAVREAVSEAVFDITAYPDPKCEELRNAISKAEGVHANSIVCGNGASELIYTAVRAALIMSDKCEQSVSILIPSFGEYEKAARAAGVSDINKVTLREENDFIPEDDDIDRLINSSNAKDSAAVIIIGNPNNPTGKLLPKTWLEELIIKAEEKGVIIILDEAFLTLTDKATYYDDIHSDKLIRIRAYTKSMAIPGVRLGYLICDNNKITDKIRSILPDWNVSLIAQKAGVAAVNSVKWLEDKVTDSENGLASLREDLINVISNADFADGVIKIYESDTNFILLKSSCDLYKELLKKGILIRDCSNFEGLGKGYYRISVKSREENQYLAGNRVNKHILLSVKPAEIERTSFEILTSELEANGIYLEGDIAPVIKRCIHTTADFKYASTLTFSDNAVAIMKELIRDGACIVTDTNMALSGINKTELSKYGGEVFCFMADTEIANIARERGCTRATASMEHAATLNKKIIFVIGNAPTALVSLCEMIDRNEFVPDFVIGVPVGFVNVEQAKEMIIERDINYIVNRGRKGGSNVAAAIVNAVLYSMRDE